MKKVIKKRHILQMTDMEKEYLDVIIRPRIKKQFNKYKPLSEHTLDRLQSKFDKVPTLYDIEDVLFNGNIIEYKEIYMNNKLTDTRIVVRKGIHSNKYDLVLVYSVKWNKVVTAWKNELTDNHRTLDLRLYDKNPLIKTLDDC